MGRSKQPQQTHDGNENSGLIQASSVDRIVYLSGDVVEGSIAQVIAAIISLANQSKTAPITLIVSTYGGSVDEMFSLYDIMKFVPCPIHTVGLGKVMSAGVLLLAAGTKGHRTIGNNTRLMMHPVSGGIHGTVFEVINETKEIVRQQELMKKLLCNESKMTKETLDKVMQLGHDHYVLPNDVIKLGLADKIIGCENK